MHTAPRVAGWVAWAVWICNSAIAGGSTARSVWLRSKESGLRPALFFVIDDTGGKRPAPRHALSASLWQSFTDSSVSLHAALGLSPYLVNRAKRIRFTHS